MLFLYEIVCSAQPIHPSSKSNEELSYSEDNGLLLLLLFFVCSLELDDDDLLFIIDGG
jgi:hypothetical protein